MCTNNNPGAPHCKIELPILDSDDFDYKYEFRKTALSILSYKNYLSVFNGTYTKKEFETFIDKGFIKINGAYTIDPDTNLIDVQGDVTIHVCDEVMENSKWVYNRIPFNFGRVEGSFDASSMIFGCDVLTTMRGFPYFVGVDCDVSNAELNSLDYAPKIVEGYLSLGYNQYQPLDFHWEPECIGRLHIPRVDVPRTSISIDLIDDAEFNDYIIRVSNTISKCKYETKTVRILKNMLNEYYDLKIIKVL